MFGGSDFLSDFERLTKGLNFGPEFEKTMTDLSNSFSAMFDGESSSDDPFSDIAERFAGKGTRGPRVAVVTDALNSKHRSAKSAGERAGGLFTLYVDLPGVDPETVDLTVEGTTLTVAATRTVGKTGGPTQSSYHRTYQLDDDLDVDKLMARSQHGVLIITVPIAEPTSTARKITIDTEPIADLDTTEPDTNEPGTEA